MLLFSCTFALIESITCPTEFSTLILFFNTSFFILFIILSSSLCNAFVTVLIAVSALLAFVNNFVPEFVSITLILPSSETYQQHLQAESDR